MCLVMKDVHIDVSDRSADLWIEGSADTKKREPGGSRFGDLDS